MIGVCAAFAASLFVSSQTPLRMWTDNPTVTVGTAFWIHTEATGTHFELPETIRAAGLAIDPINVRQASVSPSKETKDVRTTQRSFLARAQRSGPITVPPIELDIDGDIYVSEALELMAVPIPVPSMRADVVTVNTAGEIPREDLVFIDMHVDQTEVYQGEPIFFSTQLWRILYPDIDSGPYRESRIEWPTTEGFFVRDLEPLSYTEEKRSWRYDVWEERMILFPTVVGEVQIGRWHWEGVALVETKRRTRRQRLYYDLDAGPIPIQIKSIPQGPATFTGAVGSFDCTVEMSESSFLQGLPASVNVIVSGHGNPHAMGEPVWPRLTWAQLDGPERIAESAYDEVSGKLRVKKEYRYTLTPLTTGKFTVNPVVYTFFDPDLEDFRTATAEPFTLEVLASAEDWQPMVVADDVQLDEAEVAILAEDIHPTLARNSTETPARPGTVAVALAILAPALVFALAVGYTRRRSVAETRNHASIQRDALQRLDAAAKDDDPYDAIAGALRATIVKRIGSERGGSTASEVELQMIEHEFDPALTARIRSLLDTCDRARYGRGAQAESDLQSIIDEAKSCIQAIETATITTEFYDPS